MSRTQGLSHLTTLKRVVDLCVCVCVCSVEFGHYLYFLLYTLHISQVLLVHWVYEEVMCRGSVLCYIVEVHDCDDSEGWWPFASATYGRQVK